MLLMFYCAIDMLNDDNNLISLKNKECFYWNTYGFVIPFVKELNIIGQSLLCVISKAQKLDIQFAKNLVAIAAFEVAALIVSYGQMHFT